MIPPNLPVYVIHVRSAVDREALMRKQLDSAQIPFTFITEGDIADITPAIMERHFTGPRMSGPPAAVHSCAYKHLLAYRKLVESGESWALILEDDVYLAKNFTEKLSAILAEIPTTHQPEKALINLEGSMLKLVPIRDRKPDQHLYPMERGRAAGAYLLSAELAREILLDVERAKCPKPIDLYHNLLVERIGLAHYWSHPALAEQGSHNGKIASLIDQKPSGFWRQFTWQLQRLYKTYIRSLFP